MILIDKSPNKNNNNNNNNMKIFSFLFICYHHLDLFTTLDTQNVKKVKSHFTPSSHQSRVVYKHKRSAYCVRYVRVRVVQSMPYFYTSENIRSNQNSSLTVLFLSFMTHISINI